MIVSCGSGAPFGAEWRRAGRATASHSTLELEGFSSSRLGPGGRDRLTDRAKVELSELAVGPAATSLVASHEGWVATHGLTHTRLMDLSHDGRRLTAEDVLAAMSAGGQRRFEQVMTHTKLQGVRFHLRFHLHPDVDAEVDLGGSAVSLALKSGEIWVFRHSGGLELSLEPSVYLEKGRLKPRATKQIVLGGVLQHSQARIGWTLAKAQDTPLAIRDLDRDDLPA
jgi:uncharacterized heparinase superfamily protein